MHVAPQPEPAGFDAAVRRPGRRWLQRQAIPLNAPPPEGVAFPPHWRRCLDDLHRSYRGVCAYLCIFFERVGGGVSVDHFVAKSRDAGLAYEWGNYRLACSTMNSRKRDFDEVLDPFEVVDGWFHLELVTGRLYPDPTLPAAWRLAVSDTIARLGLDDPACRELRARRYQEYLEFGLPADYLRRQSPLVWSEAARQGLLR